MYVNRLYLVNSTSLSNGYFIKYHYVNHPGLSRLKFKTEKVDDQNDGIHTVLERLRVTETMISPILLWV